MEHSKTSSPVKRFSEEAEEMELRKMLHAQEAEARDRLAKLVLVSNAEHANRMLVSRFQFELNEGIEDLHRLVVDSFTSLNGSVNGMEDHILYVEAKKSKDNGFRISCFVIFWIFFVAIFILAFSGGSLLMVLKTKLARKWLAMGLLIVVCILIVIFAVALLHFGISERQADQHPPQISKKVHPPPMPRCRHIV